jgi:hypothetical protein
VDARGLDSHACVVAAGREADHVTQVGFTLKLARVDET